MGLNPEQQRAVATRKGRIRAKAVPGSGKTTVIVARIRALLTDGVKPEKLLSLTFTKEAAAEMEARAKLKEERHRIFRTFHSFALDFVTREIKSFPYQLEAFPLLLPGQRNRIIGQCIKPYPDLDFQLFSSYLSLQKRSGISPAQAEMDATGEISEQCAKAYAKYEAACRKAGPKGPNGEEGKGLLDFDSMIIETVKLLESRPEVRARWKFQHLQTDEAQDNDAVQWRLVQLLEPGKTGSLFCVGDPDQNMYEWRGAEAGGLEEKFDERFPGAVTIDLPENYRSTPQIVAYLNEICPTPGKVIRTSQPGGAPVEFSRYLVDTDEATAVMGKITDFENTAILARTNRGLRPFEDLCMIRGTRYRLLGKSGFWGQEEIKTAMAFIQYIIAPTDNSVKRILRSPFDCTRYLKKNDAVERLKEMQNQTIGGPGGKRKLHALLFDFKCGDLEQDAIVHRLAAFLQELKQEVIQLPACVAVEQIISRVGMVDYYENIEDHSEAVDNDPTENLGDLLKISGRRPTLHEFLLYAQKCATASNNKTGLTLSTIHQAKGKEWPHVFVTGVTLGTVPHKKGTPAEEKRIYYVACSRAGKRLCISCSGVPSEFIRHKLPQEEAPLEIDAAFLEDFEAIEGASSGQ